VKILQATQGLKFIDMKNSANTCR